LILLTIYTDSSFRLLGRKLRTGSPADRADPVLREFFEGNPLGDILLRIPLGGIINITAGITDPDH